MSRACAFKSWKSTSTVGYASFLTLHRPALADASTAATSSSRANCSSTFGAHRLRRKRTRASLTHAHFVASPCVSANIAAVVVSGLPCAPRATTTSVNTNVSTHFDAEPSRDVRAMRVGWRCSRACDVRARRANAEALASRRMHCRAARHRARELERSKGICAWGREWCHVDGEIHGKTRTHGQYTKTCMSIVTNSATWMERYMKNSDTRTVYEDVYVYGQHATFRRRQTRNATLRDASRDVVAHARWRAPPADEVRDRALMNFYPVGFPPWMPRMTIARRVAVRCVRGPQCAGP